jgi:hypothetical protein
MIISLLAIDCDFLLFEVSPVVLVNQDQVEDILDRELPVDVLVAGSHVDTYI